MRLSSTATLLALGLAVAVPASAATVTISDAFVLAGVNEIGTLGSNGNTSPGILYDPTGTSTYGINDFLTPGTPFEGFYISSGSTNIAWSNNTGDTTFADVNPTSLTAGSATWTGTSGGLQVTHLYSVSTVAGLSVIDITTTLTNIGTADLLDLRFLRTLDPDPDVNAFGTFFTDNTRVSENQSCGTGVNSDQTICLFTDSAITHNSGVTDEWSVFPNVYLAGPFDGDGDFSIGLAFLLGNLGAGQSITFGYDYRFGATRDVVIGDAVPEPSTVVLLGFGLAAGAVAMRRRRRNG